MFLHGIKGRGNRHCLSQDTRVFSVYSSLFPTMAVKQLFAIVALALSAQGTFEFTPTVEPPC